jgi:RNA polymerase sigma-70 factor (ECF subfamily)
MEPLHVSIKKVLAGDRDAYGAVVGEYQEMLLAYAAFRVPDAALVDEVVQQTFIRAYEQLAEYQPDKDFGIWLRAICRFMILAELKRATRERENREGYREHLQLKLLAAALERAGSQGDDDLGGRLKVCLGKLQETSRALVAYRYRQLMKIDEIARQMGQSLSWVATTLFRIRESLRKCMEAKA